MGACLSENDVLAVIAGRLSDPELRAIEAHLDACPSCRSLVACVAVGSPAATEPADPTEPAGAIDPAAPSGVPARIGRYHILRAVGAGGMGTVYAARDPELDRVVAVKLLLPSLAAHGATTLRARLAREAQAMARLAHPNVITVHDIGSVGDQLFVAMEFVEGGTLRSWLAAAPRDWRAVTEVLVAAGRGLEAAHAAGVIHRDFKPDNVLVGSDGRVRVTDFGLARLQPGDGATGGEASRPAEAALAASLSAGGALVGTPAYMAPEQLRGDGCDERSDLFGFCATSWEALYGERPFAGRTLAELSAAVCAGELRPRPDQPRLPDRLHEAIARGLAPAPDARWPSMAALLSAVDDAARPPAVRPRRPRLAIGLALAAVAAAGGAAAIALRPAHPPPATASRGERRALAVLDLVDDTPGTERARGGLLAGRLAVELGAGGALRLVPADATRRAVERNAALAHAPVTREALAGLRDRLGADLVLSGRQRAAPGGAVHLAVEIRDTATGDTAAEVALDGTDLADLAADAGQALRRRLGLRDVAGADLAAARKALPAQPEAARLFADGQALLARGDAGRARDAFEAALRIEPDQPSALAALASAWKALDYDERERDAARRAFERASGLPRELALRIEAQYREALHDWARAAEIWVTLSTFFPDELDYGLRLAQDLTRAGKLGDAQARIDRLRQLAPPAANDPRIDLAEVEIDAAHGQRDRALAAADRAARAAQRLDSDLLVARARERTCALLQDAGRFDDALAACRDGLARFEAAGDRGGVALATGSLAVLLIRFQKFDESRAPAERALAVYREIGSQTGMATVTGNIALAYAYVGDLARAERGMTDAVALYHEANERGREAMALHNLASLMTEQGKLEDAERAYRRTVEGAHALELRELELLALANLAINLLRQGQLAEARSAAQSAVALGRRLGDARRMVFALSTLGQVELRTGQLDDARKVLDEAQAENARLGAPDAGIGQHLAELTAAEGDLEAAEPLARRAAAEFHQKKLAVGEAYALTAHARLLFRLGRTADAMEVMTRVRALADEIGSDHVRQDVAASLALARAARGDVGGAIGELQTAIARSAQLHLIDTNLEQRQVLAELEGRRGRRAAARDVLAALEAEAGKRGYHQLIKEIQASRSIATTRRDPAAR